MTDEKSDSLSKRRKTNTRRAEQNRAAQNKFRQKQHENIRQMKSQIEVLEAELAKLRGTGIKDHLEELNANQNAILKQEIENLLQERERMIFIMDKLRADNELLSVANVKLRNLQNTQISQPVFRPKAHFGVKGGSGNFGAIMRPPMQNRNFGIPPWTSLKNTFVAKGSDISSSDKVSESGSSNSTKKVWRGNNQYPGYPDWTPASATAHNGPDFQPPAYHLSFSYSDTPSAHKALNKPVNVQAPQLDSRAGQLVTLPSTISTVPLLHHFPFGGQFGMSELSHEFSFENSGFGIPPLPLSTKAVSLLHHFPVASGNKLADITIEPFGDLESAFVPFKDI
jgi:hypothetical protein